MVCCDGVVVFFSFFFFVLNDFLFPFFSPAAARGRSRVAGQGAVGGGGPQGSDCGPRGQAWRKGGAAGSGRQAHHQDCGVSAVLVGGGGGGGGSLGGRGVTIVSCMAVVV